MTVRRLDENGDIVTSGVQFISGREEIAQTIRTRLRLFFGEYFRDSQDGTPHFEQILGKGSSLTNKDASIKRRIVQTPGVLQLLTYNADYDIDTREYIISGSVSTSLGEVAFNG